MVLFLPGENFFSAALANAPDLIESGVKKGVILATPATLISLLKTISFGWRREKASANARAILDLGVELYERLRLLAKHVSRLGKDLEHCTATYNLMLGSFERRVLTSVRKFRSLGLSSTEQQPLPRGAPIEKTPRRSTWKGSQ